MRGTGRTIRHFLQSERGFTLIELLITVMIIGIMASMVLFAAFQAQETAREAKTRALVAKLDAIIKTKWEGYKTRRVPLAAVQDEPFVDTGDPLSPFNNDIYDGGETFTDINGNGVWDSRNKLRLDALRDLMRMELPERYTDIVQVQFDPPSITYTVTTTPVGSYAGISPPPMYYRCLDRIRAANAANPSHPTVEFQGAEFLYLIVTASIAEDGDGREVFQADDVADVDGDGMPEFVDGWRRPIQFLRWAPGYVSDATVMAAGQVRQIDIESTMYDGDPRLIKMYEGVSDGGIVERKFEVSDGIYTGATMAQRKKNSFAWGGEGIERITNYKVVAGIPTFTISMPPTTTQVLFGGASCDDVYILSPDPFDATGIYPIHPPGGSWGTRPDISIPSFALYPLIYSAGADGCYGILADTYSGFMASGAVGPRDTNHPLSYVQNGMYPFYSPRTGFELMIGTPYESNHFDPYQEPINFRGTAADNIANRVLVTK